MAIKTYRPITPSRRFYTNVDSSDITAKASVRSLLVKLPAHAGRNNNGRITSRHKQAGAKKLYRIIDFKRNKFGIPGTVSTIEYDPYRNCRIALVTYADGEKRYIIQPKDLNVGDVIESAETGLDIKPGNAMKLKNVLPAVLLRSWVVTVNTFLYVFRHQRCVLYSVSVSRLSVLSETKSMETSLSQKRAVHVTWVSALRHVVLR